MIEVIEAFLNSWFFTYVFFPVFAFFLVCRFFFWK